MSLYEQLQSDFNIYEIEPAHYEVDIYFKTPEEFIRYAKDHSIKDIFHSVKERDEDDIVLLSESDIIPRLKERFLFYEIANDYTLDHDEESLEGAIFDKLEKFNDKLRKGQTGAKIETFSFPDGRNYGIQSSHGKDRMKYLDRYDLVTQFLDECEKIVIKTGDTLIKEAQSQFTKMCSELEQDEKFANQTSDNKRMVYARAYAAEHDYDLYYLVADNSRRFRRCKAHIVSGKHHQTYYLYEAWEKNPYRTKKARE